MIIEIFKVRVWGKAISVRHMSRGAEISSAFSPSKLIISYT